MSLTGRTWRDFSSERHMFIPKWYMLRYLLLFGSQSFYGSVGCASMIPGRCGLNHWMVWMDARSPSPFLIQKFKCSTFICFLSYLGLHPSSTFSDMNYHSLSLDHHQAVEEDTPWYSIDEFAGPGCNDAPRQGERWVIRLSRFLRWWITWEMLVWLFISVYLRSRT